MKTSLRPLVFLLSALLFAACVAEPECQLNGDCPSTHQCLGGACVPRPEEPVESLCGERGECVGAEDCESGLCENGCCAITCGDDRECFEDEVCRGNWCRPIGAPCLSNNDCSHNWSTPTCDLDSGTCVRCLTSADCGLGEYCENRGCHLPPTGGCVEDQDCTEVAELGKCFAATGHCVACLYDSDCSLDGSIICDPANHACRTARPGCGWDGDCVSSANGRRCRQDRVCVQCLVDEDCRGERKCLRDNTCTEWNACSSDADCSAPTGKCRSEDMRCVECTASSQCGEGKLCRDGACIPSSNGCAVDAHCSSSLPACDPATRTCVRCLDMDDCNGGFCEGQTCTPCTGDLDCLLAAPHRPWCAQDGCRQCIGDDDCGDGLVCKNYKCDLDPVDQPCPLSGICERGYRCLLNEFGVPTCRAPCDPFGPNTCPAGKACDIATFQAGLAVGACVERVSGASQLGQACSATQPCDVDGECVQTSATSATCRKRCDPGRAGAQCASPDVCQLTAQTDLQGVPRSVGLCFPDTKLGDGCVKDSDCNAGQICGAGPNPQNPLTWGNFCRWPAGSKTGGQSCFSNAECKSEICIQGAPGGGGYCQGACSTNADCPARGDGVPGVCGVASIPWVDFRGNPTSVEVPSCVLPCREDAECRPDQFCELVANASKTDWTTRCAPALNTSGAKGGGTCFADTECRSGSCLKFGTAPAGICAGVCGPANGDAGCHQNAVCPPNGVWRRVGPGNDGILGNADDPQAAAPLCWTKPCTTNTECGHGRVCGALPDPLNPQDIVLACQPNQGTVEGGGICQQNDQCRSGLCRFWSSGNGRCFGACSTNADCPGAQCQTIRWTSTQPNKDVRVCVP